MQNRQQGMQGLSTHEVEERRAHGLGCVPPPVTGRSYLRILRENVLNAINVILFSLKQANLGIAMQKREFITGVNTLRASCGSEVAIGVYLAVLIPASLSLPVPGNPYREGALPLAQTALTVFLVLCGLILLLFLEPPTRARPGKQGKYSNWLPSLLVLGLFICLLIVLAVPALRALFNLQVLSALSYVIILGAGLFWAILVWLILHFHLFEHVF